MKIIITLLFVFLISILSSFSQNKCLTLINNETFTQKTFNEGNNIYILNRQGNLVMGKLSINDFKSINVGDKKMLLEEISAVKCRLDAAIVLGVITSVLGLYWIGSGIHITLYHLGFAGFGGILLSGFGLIVIGAGYGIFNTRKYLFTDKWNIKISEIEPFYSKPEIVSP